MRIVVCLSTIPSRVEYLPLTIQSLLDQTVKADNIYIFVPKWSKKEKCIYPETFTANNEYVKIIENDEGPITKLYPIFQFVPEAEDENTVVISVDDDSKYDSTMIESLLHAYQSCPSKYDVVSNSGWIINGWSNICYPMAPIPVDWVEAFCSILYPMRSLRRIQQFMLQFDVLPQARSCDDIWICAWIQYCNPECTMYVVPLLNNKRHELTEANYINSLRDNVTVVDDSTKDSKITSNIKTVSKNRRVALTLRKRLNVFHTPTLLPTEFKRAGTAARHCIFGVKITLLIILIIVLLLQAWFKRRQQKLQVTRTSVEY
jgi:hypothetical protein